MRTRRQYQPSVDGLPYRIAPSSLVVAPAVSLLASTTMPPAMRTMPTMSPCDTDMPETGTPAPILAGPPPSGGDGTLLS